MLVAQLAAADLQRFAIERLGFVEFPLGLEEGAQAVDREQGVPMFVAPLAAADLQRLAVELLSFVVFASVEEE